MKPFLLAFFLAISLSAQVVAPPIVPVPVPVIPTGTLLPMYIAGGGAYNQFAGLNLWASAIVPVSSSSGIYESTTTDLFPVKATVGGKSAYIFQASVREGVHKVLHQDAKNVFLLGADAGFSFAQATAGGSASSGVSAAVTITYVRQLSKNWAVMIPVRALYMPSLGGWNPICEIGLVFKP